jgi:hypothetical protein
VTSIPRSGAAQYPVTRAIPTCQGPRYFPSRASCLSLQMPRTLRLLNRDITLEEALSEDDDILHEISYPQKRLDFYYYLLEHRDDLEQLVSFHLRVPREKCLVARDFKEWIHGSFNACIPVYVDVSPRFSAKKVFMRFPLPYKVGESEFPGNAEEKLRCEVATYIWIQTHHPDVPIPSLRGFGFAHGRSVCSLNCPLQLLPESP